MVVHDLKNPLTALIGFLEMMRMGEERLAPDQRLFLANALRSGHNLSGLIGDVLDVAQLEEGKFDLNKNAFLLQLLLRDCADEMGAWLLQEEKTIWVDAPEDLPLALADQRLMRRVLLNLISNAIKHTPQGTAITLRARSTPAGATVEIEDNGPGIPPEHLGRIFDRFSRLSGTAHARQQNTGLGLTFCRLAVEAHGGSIEVESELGQGTTFRVLLPFQPVQMPQASAATLEGITLPAHV
jgi:two-component system, OmpR family, sensor kinase